MKKLAPLLSALAALFAISALVTGWKNAINIVTIPAAIVMAIMSSKSATMFAGELGAAMKLTAFGMAMVAISWLMGVLGELFKGHASTFVSMSYLAGAVALVVLTIGFYKIYQVAASVAEERIGHPEGPGK